MSLVKIIITRSWSVNAVPILNFIFFKESPASIFATSGFCLLVLVQAGCDVGVDWHARGMYVCMLGHVSEVTCRKLLSLDHQAES